MRRLTGLPSCNASLASAPFSAPESGRAANRANPPNVRGRSGRHDLQPIV